MTKYFQCIMSQLSEDAKVTNYTIAWIEERGAKEGASIEILDEGFWTVDRVYKDFYRSREDISEKQRKDRRSLPSIRKSE